MSQMSNSYNDAVGQPAPLFASSWVAFFIAIRSGFAGMRDDESQQSGEPDSADSGDEI